MFKIFHKKIKYNSGMTLVELMVVLAIFVIVTGITIFDYASFNSNISLQKLADDVSLSIRKAQSYAIGAKGISGSFSDSYGIHFSTQYGSGNDLGGSSKSFILFVDKNKNNKYDAPSSNDLCSVSYSECAEILSIKTEDKITGIFVNGKKNEGKEEMDILFFRPNPDAHFYVKGSNINDQKVEIEITNTRSLKIKIISISNTGQISIE